MNFSLLLAVSCLLNPEPLSLELQEAEIVKVAEVAGQCRSQSDFEPLFKLSSSRTITGAHTSEELAEVNEEAFLKCPLLFLRALKAQPEGDLANVLDYFGVRHPPWELGSELRKWEKHEDVGEFVRTQLKGYLEIEEPK